MDVTKHLIAALGDRYQIERDLGSGGMATVYLARDVKHNRKVALKVLRPELGAVLGTDRFLSEISVTANLQHPNLLPLFDSGEAEGLLFYVMPFIEGESLRDRLNRDKQLGVDEAVRIAIAVASALNYAHRHGVVHRDLKPENILLNDGQPVVADFGIALAVSNAGGARVTQSGLSLGTPQYMSPEQATGDRTIDARSDIYSLGAVLYEMLTGDPPHTGSTVQAIIAKVLTDRPQSVRAYRDTVPQHVDYALQRALAKLPADRFATASDFADALSGARAVTVRTTAHTIATYDVFPTDRASVRRRRVKAAVPWMMFAAAVVAAAVIALRTRPPRAGSPSMFPVTLLDSMELRMAGGTTVAISHDGSKLALLGTVAGVPGILVRPMNGVHAQFVRGTDNATTPSFSPDGEWLLFFADGQLKKVPVGGGAAITVADSAGAQSSWGDRGEILYERGLRGLWRVSSEGGDATLLTRPDTSRGHTRIGWPHQLPGGKAALITVFKGSATIDGAHLGVIEIPSGKVTELGVIGTNPRYVVSTGHIVFARADGSVFAAPFSLRSLRLTGPIEPVLEGVVVKPGGPMEIAISDNGTLVYKSGESGGGQRRLLGVDRSGSAQPLISQALAYVSPRIAITGRRIAVTISTAAGADIWIYDLGSGALTRLTTDGRSSRAEWSPDGQRIAYVRSTGLDRSIYWQPWDGSGAPEILAKKDSTNFAEVSFGPPGTWNAFRRGLGGGNTGAQDIWIAPTNASPNTARPFLVSTSAMEIMPRISPDGRLLAYVSDESGRHEVYLRPVPGPGARVQVSTGGGTEAIWARDGRELFYRAPTHFMAATIQRAPEVMVARQDTLFEDRYLRSQMGAPHPNYDVFPDGQRFVVVQGPGSENVETYAIVNWAESLRPRRGRVRGGGGGGGGG